MIRSNFHAAINLNRSSNITDNKVMNWLSNFKIIIYVLSIISLFSYLVVVNRTNTMGYEIAEMELKVRNLKEQYRDLEGQATELQSMQRIKDVSNNVLSMVQSESFSYLSSVQSSVAVNK